MKVGGYIKFTLDKDIEFGEVEISPKPTDLIIKTTHVGLAKGDLYILNNKWGDTVYPAAGTGETIGVVESVGSAVSGFNVGDRVGAQYILGSCMTCEYCKKGLHHYCSKQINTSLGGWGGMLEKISVDHRLVVKIPENLKSEDATPLVGYGVTAYSGIQKANLKSNDKVGVIGIGGLGYIAAKILTAMNMETTFFSHSPEKEKLTKSLNFSKFVLVTDKKALVNMKRKYNLIIDASSGNLELSSYLDLLRPDGKFCYLGLPFNKQTFDATQLADYGSRTIYGSYVGSISEINELLTLASKYGPLTETVAYPISDLEKAIEFVENSNTHKRVVLRW